MVHLHIITQIIKFRKKRLKPPPWHYSNPKSKDFQIFLNPKSIILNSWNYKLNTKALLQLVSYCFSLYIKPLLSWAVTVWCFYFKENANLPLFIDHLKANRITVEERTNCRWNLNLLFLVLILPWQGFCLNSPQYPTSRFREVEMRQSGNIQIQGKVKMYVRFILPCILLNLNESLKCHGIAVH